MISKITERLFGNQIVSSAREYLAARGYQTQTHELREGCFVIKGQRNEIGVTETHLLMVITAGEEKASKEHIEHLVKLGRKQSADDLSVVCDVPATAPAQKTAAKAPLNVIDKSDLDTQPPENALTRGNPSPEMSSEDPHVTRGGQRRGSDRRNSRQVDSIGQKLRLGALYGAIAWIVGYGVSWILFETDSNLEEQVIGESELSTWEAVGLTFYNSHLADTVLTIDAGREEISG